MFREVRKLNARTAERLTQLRTLNPQNHVADLFIKAKLKSPPSMNVYVLYILNELHKLHANFIIEILNGETMILEITNKDFLINDLNIKEFLCW